MCIWSIDSNDKELCECNYPLVGTDEARGLESASPKGVPDTHRRKQPTVLV